MPDKVMVIGAGNWGKNLVRTFYELGALYGVAEASSELRSAVQEQYPDVAVYADYREAVQADVQAAVIATPAHTHFEIAKTCIQAGKDVFVEKPITLSSADTRELIRLAEEADKLLMVGHLLLYQPAIQMIKTKLDEGLIGELRSIHQERMKLGRVRAVENVLWSFGVHDIAVITYLTGQAPDAIQASGQSIIQPDIEDDVFVHMHFGQEVSAHLHVSWLWPELQRKLVVIGTKGMLVYDENKQTLTFHDKGIEGATLQNRDAGTELLMEGAEQPLRLECQHFLDCVASRRQPISDGWNGEAVVRIMETISARLQGGN